MSHAASLLAILEREQRKQIRVITNPRLSEALRRAHQVQLQSARLLEMSEMLVVAVKS